jgi:hypothetical protein
VVERHIGPVFFLKLFFQKDGELAETLDPANQRFKSSNGSCLRRIGRCTYSQQIDAAGSAIGHVVDATPLGPTRMRSVRYDAAEIAPRRRVETTEPVAFTPPEPPIDIAAIAAE